jgi:hypothetical protein
VGKNNIQTKRITHFMRILSDCPILFHNPSILHRLKNLCRWMWIPLGLIGVFLLIQSSSAGSPIPQDEFEARKQEMIEQDT